MKTLQIKNREERLRETTERIFQYLEVKGISDAEFARIIDKPRQHVSTWRTGKGSISATSAMKVVEEFNDLNVEWLIKGEGEMLGEITESQRQIANTQLLKIEQLGKYIEELLEENKLYREHIKLLNEKIQMISGHKPEPETHYKNEFVS